MAHDDTKSAAGAKALTNYLADNADRVMLTALKGALVVALCAVGAYIIVFRGQPFVVNPERWGQLGDYIGGILNPIFGFLSVLGLLIALVLQTTELKLSREALLVSQRELELSRAEQAKASEALTSQNKSILKQSFEQTFFSWLETYRAVLEDIREDTEIGRSALSRIWHNYFAAKNITSTANSNIQNNQAIRYALYLAGSQTLNYVKKEQYQRISEAALITWEAVYKEKEQNLDRFYRTIYRLIKWIDTHGGNFLTEEDKWLYVGIIRSQLSWLEMAFLFYNGMTPRGEKFKPLIEKYALFDNLTVESDALLVILKECPMDGIGYAPSAFNSDIARESKKIGDSRQTPDNLPSQAPQQVLN